ncbi:4592_t:CDS:2 [Cetraspora pellucida]|uniref:4592_t:CDS:1 n=1 Tax=Cetraspora pellucida TaxID=1433469 RepID=A0A9N9AKA2_9GLOM|nr:4592_t:CDS:2 [Cetraspora pellucida]
MSNEKSLSDIYNNPSTELIKSAINNDNTSEQIDISMHNSQVFLNKVIDELCNVYNKEVMKGNPISSILYSIEQYFINKQQNPEEIINLYNKLNKTRE